MLKLFSAGWSDDKKRRESQSSEAPPPAYEERAGESARRQQTTSPNPTSPKSPSPRSPRTPRPPTCSEIYPAPPPSLQRPPHDRPAESTSAFPPPLETGAYVIRHVGRPSSKKPQGADNVVSVQFHSGVPGEFKPSVATLSQLGSLNQGLEKQVWWIEKCSELVDVFPSSSTSSSSADTGNIYSISNIAFDAYLTGSSDGKKRGKGARAPLLSDRFAPDAFWRIQPIMVPSSATTSSKRGKGKAVTTAEEDPIVSWGYSVTNVATNLPLIPSSPSHSTGALLTDEPSHKKPSCTQIGWRFDAPPPNPMDVKMFRIRLGNLPSSTSTSSPTGGTGDFLRHDHASSLPYIWHSNATSASSSPEEKRRKRVDSLATQWSIIPLTTYDSVRPPKYSGYVYLIRNRLTKCYLRNVEYAWGASDNKSVIAASNTAKVEAGPNPKRNIGDWEDGVLWRLEKKQGGLWKVINPATGGVLSVEKAVERGGVFGRRGEEERKLEMRKGDMIESEGMFWSFE